MCRPSRSTIPLFDGSTARMRGPSSRAVPGTRDSGARDLRSDRLRAGLVDVVERRLGDPGEPGEAGVGDDAADRGLPGLRAEGVAAGLRHGVLQAEEGREAVVDAADRVEVAGRVVLRGGL